MQIRKKAFDLPKKRPVYITWIYKSINTQKRGLIRTLTNICLYH